MIIGRHQPIVASQQDRDSQSDHHHRNDAVQDAPRRRALANNALSLVAPEAQAGEPHDTRGDRADAEDPPTVLVFRWQAPQQDETVSRYTCGLRKVNARARSQHAGQPDWRRLRG